MTLRTKLSQLIHIEAVRLGVAYAPWKYNKDSIAPNVNTIIGLII